FQLGAADYLVKPAPAEVIIAKAAQILTGGGPSTGARGVAGSLSEMSLPDVLQVLSHGRKTGRLRLTAGGTAGEIHFEKGEVHHAILGDLLGEAAFYSMLRLTDGNFALDPLFRPKERTIRQSTESLLLEGMRRLDERL